MCWILEGVYFPYLVPRKHLAADCRRENEAVHLIHEDTMLFGCSLFSASISPSPGVGNLLKPACESRTNL